ncbi:ABC transporter permease [Brevibacterium gallinarum]|uniref:Transport permease protein n=1 Tax=Brevibacterium gallinarum TaxID=2762220 RepID=A0ABR8WXM1_9MICO|nr:ABC transporter permease [Brevibacterium gallinarum]MBD8021658.1 ABC transporter permease [Brevibacterium gallinarum]
MSTGIDAPGTHAGQHQRVRRVGPWLVAEKQLLFSLRFIKTALAVTVLTPVFYIFSLGLGLGTVVDSAQPDGVGGVPYLLFVAPAMLATAGMMFAVEESTYPVMAGFRWNRGYWAAAATTLTPAQIALGAALATAIRVAVITTIYFLIIAFVFDAVPNPLTGWLMIPLAAVGGTALGFPVMAFTATLTRDSGQFALIQRVVVMPLMLFSGTFFPLANLPLSVQWIGWLSPLWHTTELGRLLSYHQPMPGVMIAVHLACIFIPSAVGLLVAMRLFTQRLTS